jgi:hypothetical protein
VEAVTRGRIGGDRREPSVEAAEKGLDEVKTRRKQKKRARPRIRRLQQANRDRPRVAVEFPECQAGGFRFAIVQKDIGGPKRLIGGRPRLQQCDQSLMLVSLWLMSYRSVPLTRHERTLAGRALSARGRRAKHTMYRNRTMAPSSI